MPGAQTQRSYREGSPWAGGATSGPQGEPSCPAGEEQHGTAGPGGAFSQHMVREDRGCGRMRRGRQGHPLTAVCLGREQSITGHSTQAYATSQPAAGKAESQSGHSIKGVDLESEVIWCLLVRTAGPSAQG